jgi:hypothetical protein
MYWYRSKLRVSFSLIIWIALAVCWSGCKPDIKESGAYFDIKGYFTGDTARLRKLNKPVIKTVSHNGLTESKTVRIDNWARELDLFIGSDINRPAWKNSYTVIDNDGFLIYKAKYPELVMREMLIKKDKGKVKWILIYNRTKNILYQTSEKLSYFPDSLYLIEKVQRVRFMGNNSYKIQGVIKK